MRAGYLWWALTYHSQPRTQMRKDSHHFSRIYRKRKYRKIRNDYVRIRIQRFRQEKVKREACEFFALAPTMRLQWVLTRKPGKKFNDFQWYRWYGKQVDTS